MSCSPAFVLSVLALLPASLAAQTYTAQKIVFSQLGSFTQQQLEDAAGLHSGSTFTTAELGAAAQRLVNTGYFDGIDATLDGKLTAVTVKFDDKPTPLAAMLHVGFENFVWLTHDEIQSAVKSRFPLFIEYLPENSPHQDDIKAALVSALAAKSITAGVAYDTYEPTLFHPRREISFRVTNPSIKVANVKLTGVTPALVPLVQKSINATARTSYTEGPADLTTADRVLAPLLDSGYIDARLAGITVAPAPAESGVVALVLSAALIPGDIYNVSALTFAGTPVLSAADFNAATKLHAGDVASHKALLQSLESIDSAYRRLGYMDVVVMSNPRKDVAAHQVSYEVSVTPGEQYRIHEVTTNNLDSAAKADFDRVFLLKPGTLYNPDYVRTFLRNNSAVRSFERYSAGFKAYADPSTHTVDLVITFARSGS